MYTVVGCSECSSLWVVEGRPETTQCPSCQKRHQFRKLKRFHESDDAAEAKQARAAMLAKRQGHEEAIAEMDHFAIMERQLNDVGVDDDTYLEAKGVDTDSVDAAGERASQGAGGSRSRKETVEAALRECDPATEAAIVDYAAEADVPPAATRRLLEKLVQSGGALRDGDTYRPV